MTFSILSGQNQVKHCSVSVSERYCSVFGLVIFFLDILCISARLVR